MRHELTIGRRRTDYYTSIQELHTDSLRPRTPITGRETLDSLRKCIEDWQRFDAINDFLDLRSFLAEFDRLTEFNHNTGGTA